MPPDTPETKEFEARPITTVSDTGAVCLPLSVMAAQGWSAGTLLEIDIVADGIMLRRASIFPPTRPEQVFGCLAYSGPTLTVDQVDDAVIAEIRRRHELD